MASIANKMDIAKQIGGITTTKEAVQFFENQEENHPEIIGT